jgi:hypothetical protein
MTKFIEIIAFKKHDNKPNNKIFQYSDFPLPIQNNISENSITSIVIPTYIKNQKDITDIENLLQSIER